MTRHAPILLVVVACANVHAAAPPETLHAGPLYTVGSENAASADGPSPVFPQVQILLDTGDASVKPDANGLKLSIDGKDCGTATKLDAFSASGHGLAAAFSIDVSGSMKGAPLNAVRRGLVRFVDQAGPRDHIAIQTVADEGHWDSEWNAPRGQLRSALENLKTRGKLTRLWDAVFEALGSYSNQPPGRRLVVVSDGHDEGSARTEDQVVTAALAHRVVVDAIGLTRSNPAYLMSLESLSAQTGGHYRRAADERELEDLVANGIRISRSRPLATFQARDIKADGLVHRFRVTWKHGGVETAATFSAPLPKLASTSKETSWWWLVVPAVLGLALIVFYVFRRKPKPAAVAAAPTAAAPPPPFRSPTAVRPPAPKPFVSGPPAPPTPAPAPVKAPGNSLPSMKTQVAARFPPPSAEQPAAWLHCESGVAPGVDVPIHAAEFWLGGLDNNHFALDQDQTVSANHACIVFEQGSLGIIDNNSTNGTWVNEQRIAGHRHLLWPGDRVRVGRSTFVVTLAPSRALI